MRRLMLKLAAVSAVGTIFLAAASAAANNPEGKPNKAGSSTVATVPAGDPEAVEIAYLQPFTNIAEIPAGSDLASIRFEGIKAVKVATRRTISTSDKRYCEEGYREPGGSMYCPSVEDGSFVPAYQVTYSYNGPLMGADEYGSNHFTFSVNLHPEDLNLTAREMRQAATAENFKLTTYRGLVAQVVIDEANSAFCAGNYIDGLWTHADRDCHDQVTYKTAAVPSGYVAVRVEPAAGAPATTASR